MRQCNLHLNSVFSKMITLWNLWLLDCVRVWTYLRNKTRFRDCHLVFVIIKNDSTIGDRTIKINAIRKRKHVRNFKTKLSLSTTSRCSEFVTLFCSNIFWGDRTTIAMTIAQRIKFSRSFHFTVQMQLVGDLYGHCLIHN